MHSADRDNFDREGIFVVEGIGFCVVGDEGSVVAVSHGDDRLEEIHKFLRQRPASKIEIHSLDPFPLTSLPPEMPHLVHGFDVDGVFVCFVLENELFQVEKCSFVRYVLPDLYPHDHLSVAAAKGDCT